jgi:hypothetical protein
VNTGYYGKHAKLPNAVAASRVVPEWFFGEVAEELAPTWEVMKIAKEGGDWRKAYRENVLNNLNPVKIFLKYEDKVLLCYEKNEKDCHRGIIAEWIEENIMGVRVSELDNSEQLELF